jgi:hypothetical protein
MWLKQDGWHDGENADHVNCIFQSKYALVLWAFNNVNVKSSSRCSLVDILRQELNHTNPKTPLKPSIFIYCYVKSSSRYSLVRILPCELDHANPKLLQD